MKVLITGITGFAGSHLAEYALRMKAEVFGVYRQRSRMDNIGHLMESVNLVECDIRDAFSVESTIKSVQPDWIFHLAAQTYVPTSWSSPAETFTTNLIGELNVLEAVRRFSPRTRVQVACSSEEYGLVHEHELPINEMNPLRPLSPYGVSKVAQDLLAYQYNRSYGLHVVRTRAFNHTGPRRGEPFMTSSFCKQVALIESGLSEPVLRCGNLSAIRDFTDVRDMVRGYWLAVEHGDPGDVYVIASGSGYSAGQVLDLLLGWSKRPISVETDPNRMRPSDVAVLIGDSGKFRRLTGWRPEIPFETTLSDLLEYWRERIAHSQNAGSKGVRS